MKALNIYMYREFAEKWRNANVNLGDEYLRQQGFKSAMFNEDNGVWLLDEDDYWMFQLLWGDKVLSDSIKAIKAI